MLSLQNKLAYIGKALNGALPGLVFHYWRPDSYPYLVWQEDMEGDSFNAGNHKEEQAIHCVAHYYTQTEYDPNIDVIQEVFNCLECPFRIESVQYEEETQLIHYTWEFEVCEIGET